MNVCPLVKSKSLSQKRAPERVGSGLTPKCYNRLDRFARDRSYLFCIVRKKNCNVNTRPSNDGVVMTLNIRENMLVVGRLMLEDETERMENNQVQKNINLGSGP
jgi:hypothetical protein